MPILRNSSTKLYYCWVNMRRRCDWLKHKDWKYYGGKGISVCKEWNNFINFKNDMGKTYRKGLSIDRIDNNKGYFKDNCRWVTMKMQQNNKTNSHPFTFNGLTMNLYDWSKKLKINKSTLSMRIYVYGWSIRDALTRKVGNYAYT